MWDDIWFSARDGVRLYARRYRGGTSRRPLLCIPGLVGNSAEFHGLASAIATNGPESRSVYCIDCRGRGRSRLGRSRKAPSMLVECEDILDLATMAGLNDFAVLGSGYGGQLAIILNLLRPRAVGGLILNDSGPEFEIEGLVRQLGEIANMPLPKSWQDAGAILERLHGRKYPRLSGDDWVALAKEYFLERGGRPALAFDPSIVASHSLSRSQISRVSFWQQFAALSRVPMLLIKAERSDMLSPQTIARMLDVHSGLGVTVAQGQGHPALLREAGIIAVIAKFLANHEWADRNAASAFRAVA